jgi:hypothetical protein
MDVTPLLTALDKYGALFVLAALLASGWLIPKSVYLREVVRADTYEKLAQNALETMARLVNPPKP